MRKNPATRPKGIANQTDSIVIDDNQSQPHLYTHTRKRKKNEKHTDDDREKKNTTRRKGIANQTEEIKRKKKKNNNIKNLLT